MLYYPGIHVLPRSGSLYLQSGARVWVIPGDYIMIHYYRDIDNIYYLLSTLSTHTRGAKHDKGVTHTHTHAEGMRRALCYVYLGI